MQGIMKQVIFREDQIPDLDKLARGKGVNRSVVVRWAVDEYIKKNLPVDSLQEILSHSDETKIAGHPLTQPA